MKEPWGPVRRLAPRAASVPWDIRPATQERDTAVGYTFPMVATVDKPAAVLVVTGPARDRLYDRFRRLYQGRDDVRVVVDRRGRQRRGSPVRVGIERRRVERRVSAPWLVFPPA